VYLAHAGRALGVIAVADVLKPDAAAAVAALRRRGLEVAMLTGDQRATALAIARQAGIERVLAEVQPEAKAREIAALRAAGRVVAMVGDGINDAPALAAANVGIAMGARGASASSEAADVVILTDRLDRVSDAIAIAKRARGIAVQSIVVGLALSGVAMAFAAIGWLPPVAGALTQEAIDVAVILNALRALTPGHRFGRPAMPLATATILRQDHELMESALDRLREIADALDDAAGMDAVALICEADDIIERQIVKHERDDEASVYPNLAQFLADNHGLGAMSRAHREIIHLARLLGQLQAGLTPQDADRYLIRDAQRVIESIESLVRIHNAQEEDIYEHATSGHV
jgi:soluble P-type ATPase